MSSFDHFPEEVVEEIMSWLPADSLVRFKRVCKSWYALISGLIDDPSFVAKHLCNTKRRSSSSLIFAQFCPHDDHGGIDCHGDKFTLVTVLNAYRDDDHILSITEELDLPPPRNEGHNKLGRWKKAYHCDGLICLVQDPQTITVCNPVLRECRLLPVNYAQNARDFLPSAMGFGYDSRANQYKFVAIWGGFRAEVHTLGTDSWREYILPEDWYICDFLYQDPVYRRGVCYWLVQDFPGNDFLLCFDMSSEEFYCKIFPDAYITKFMEHCIGLSIWNDRVAFFLCSRDYRVRESPLYIDILVMVDYSRMDNGAASWNHQFVSGPVEASLNTLSIIQNNEFLMQDRDISKA